MPRGTQSITESIKRVTELQERLVRLAKEIAAEKAEANKKAKVTPAA